MSKDNLGDRMKHNYENRYRFSLTRRTPVIIRIDGKAFHTFTRPYKKPFDYVLAKTMADTAMTLCKEIMGCQLAYVQSDEISLLLVDYKRLESEAWFDNNLQKMVSISASLATLAFNTFLYKNIKAIPELIESGWENHILKDWPTPYLKNDSPALFDARAFNIPEAEVCNYFIWRQQDATRNSIESVGHVHFTNRELHKVNCNQLQEKLLREKGVDWASFPRMFKYGVCIKKLPLMSKNKYWIIDPDTPIFTQSRKYIEELLIPDRK